MASGGSKHPPKQNSPAPRVVDEESKFKEGDSGRRKHQWYVPSEGTVNGFARSRSGSNDLSDDDVEILEISDPEKEAVEVDVRKKEWERKRSTGKAGCSVTVIDKQQKSEDLVAISVSDSDEEVKSLNVTGKEEEKKRAINKGKEKAEAMAEVSQSSFGSVKKSGSAMGKKCNKAKKPRRKNVPVPVPCVAWRTRSFRDQQRERVKYSQFFGKEKMHSDSDTSDSYSTWESLESDERKEEESESQSQSQSESKSGSDSYASSDSNSVTEAKSLESDEGPAPAEKKRRYKGHEMKRRRVPPFGADKRAPPLRKVAGEEKDVEEPGACAVPSDDSEDVPVPAKKKKTRRHEMTGEGCSRVQPTDRDEWASIAKILVPSSDESDAKSEKVAKKTRCEKEKPVEREKQVGGSTRAKRKREKQPAPTKDILDYIMNMMDCEEEGVPEGSEPQVDRNAPQELPLLFDWRDEEPPVEKSEFDELVDEAWLDFDNALAYEEIGTYNPQQEKDKDSVHSGIGNYCPDGKHDMYLDEEIGYLCRKCSYVETEIRHILPLFAPKGRNAVVGQNMANARNLLHYGDLHEQNATCQHSQPTCQKNGTVWDLIPGVINTMYPHQREAFEFIWRNLAGSIELDKLKTQDSQSDDLGGCVISHAPGTGKTRLAIVFIQSYMKAFPNCKPIIFAPASIMNTWETEFKKWDFDLPFHNMNSEDLTGKEDTKIVDMIRGEPRTMQLARAIKLCSWVKGNGVLGMSYDLFREYALGKSSADSKERELLLEKPGLIVLDEGHTPRNDRSRLWKAFNEVKTEKRIILSGTPFQNTFLELHNTLCLVRPRFAQRFDVPIERSDRAMKKKKQTKDVWNTPTKNVTDENADKVRSVLKPFVHVHAGGILKSLPGLRECVIMLNPEPIQKEAIQNLSLVINSGTFDSEYKTSLASIHPFLLTSVNKIKEGEISLLKMDILKSLRYDPSAGVKTKFVVEFVRLLKSDPLKERVLIFSQYIEPLNLIKEQLTRMFQWTEETEVLQIYGKILTNERQRFINSFNDMNSNARVLLASTKACSEGISLTGASRVIMLDVVWNPAVGKQAISRAFRIGQEKVVYTYNLITTGTGEMEKYDVQGKKDKLSKLVFSPEAEAGCAGITRGLVAEDRLLEKLTSNDKLKGMFEKIYYTKSDD